MPRPLLATPPCIRTPAVSISVPCVGPSCATPKKPLPEAATKVFPRRALSLGLPFDVQFLLLLAPPSRKTRRARVVITCQLLVLRTSKVVHRPCTSIPLIIPEATVSVSTPVLLTLSLARRRRSATFVTPYRTRPLYAKTGVTF